MFWKTIKEKPSYQTLGPRSYNTLIVLNAGLILVLGALSVNFFRKLDLNIYYFAVTIALLLCFSVPFAKFSSNIPTSIIGNALIYLTICAYPAKIFNLRQELYYIAANAGVMLVVSFCCLLVCQSKKIKGYNKKWKLGVSYVVIGAAGIISHLLIHGKYHFKGKPFFTIILCSIFVYIYALYIWQHAQKLPHNALVASRVVADPIVLPITFVFKLLLVLANYCYDFAKEFFACIFKNDASLALKTTPPHAEDSKEKDGNYAVLKSIAEQPKKATKRKRKSAQKIARESKKKQNNAYKKHS